MEKSHFVLQISQTGLLGSFGNVVVSLQGLVKRFFFGRLS
jgi:hypothetical protein